MKNISMIFLVLGLLLGTRIAFGMDSQSAESDPLYDYELFKIVQRIHDIVDEARDEAKSLDTCIGSGRETWSDPDLSARQTKKGLFLLDDIALWSPWGAMHLQGSVGDGTPLGFLLFKQHLLRRVRKGFFRVEKCTTDKPKYHLLKPDVTDVNSVSFDQYRGLTNSKFEKDCAEVFTKISEEELDALKGQDVFVISDFARPVYSVHAVDGQTLPDPKLLELRDYRKSDDVAKAWNAMKTRYDAELGMQG